MAGDLVPISYIAGTAASIATVLGGTRAYYSRQRKRWTEEGRRAQRNAEALEHNTQANKANTQAIERMVVKFDAFAEEIRRELRTHDTRIQRLEDLSGRRQQR